VGRQGSDPHRFHRGQPEHVGCATALMLPDPEGVIAHLSEPTYRPSKLKELARDFGVDGDDYRTLRQLMRELEVKGKVTRVHKGRYVLPAALKRTWGR
ncbi:MAG: hypothetical protein VCE12_03615, partial [Candidatus Latescibacterota bacterium]